MITKHVLRAVPATAILLGLGLFNSPMPVSAADSQQTMGYSQSENSVTADLKELRSLMAKLNYDADKLESLHLSPLHKETHASYLTQVKERVNRVGEQLEALQATRSIAAPWQLAAIDDVFPIAVQLASSTSSALTHIRDNGQQLRHPSYLADLRTITNLSDEMHGVMDNHLKIMETQDKLQMLQDQLDGRDS
jgi:hypothetical protein